MRKRKENREWVLGKTKKNRRPFFMKVVLIGPLDKLVAPSHPAHR